MEDAAGGVELWLLPQPESIPAPAPADTRRSAKYMARTLRFRKNGRRTESKPRPAIEVLATRAEIELPLVETETVKVLAFPLTRFKVAGAVVHVAPAGAPVQPRVTVPLVPAEPVSDRLYVAVCPPVTVALVEPPGAAPMAKPETIPVPERATVCGLEAALSAKVSVPVCALEVTGMNVTFTVHVAAGASTPPQVSVSANPSEAPTLAILTGWSPELLTVTDCWAEVVPTAWLPKSSVPGAKLS